MVCSTRMNTGIASDFLYIIEQDLMICPNNRRGGETLCSLIAFAEWYVRVLPPAGRVRPASWIDALTDRLTGAAADVSADNSRRRTAQWRGGEWGTEEEEGIRPGKLCENFNLPQLRTKGSLPLSDVGLNTSSILFTKPYSNYKTKICQHNLNDYSASSLRTPASWSD